eukprot:TRINITY_DN4836_c0_g1_i1.p2 TRINITY_DN4836_c0_g1~~TRINITY_DN4836_c0_g1_i1.p2  ORF type:complete len:120 (+),score=5.36 TRINITY_DN4836_c0_g1_i1:133-492(+)
MPFLTKVLNPTLMSKKVFTCIKPKTDISTIKKPQTVTCATPEQNTWGIGCDTKSRQLNKLPSGVFTGVAIMLCTPTLAQATVTPSLQNLLYSVLAGAIIAGIIGGGVVFVSTFDPVNRI